MHALICLPPGADSRVLDAAVVLDRWALLQHAWATRGNQQAEVTQDVEAADDSPLLGVKGGPGGAVALLHSDAERREFISAGAAAGLAVRHNLKLAESFFAPLSPLDCIETFPESSTIFIFAGVQSHAVAVGLSLLL